jgi:hypothetical protein
VGGGRAQRRGSSGVCEASARGRGAHWECSSPGPAKLQAQPGLPPAGADVRSLRWATSARARTPPGRAAQCSARAAQRGFRGRCRTYPRAAHGAMHEDFAEEVPERLNA